MISPALGFSKFPLKTQHDLTFYMSHELATEACLDRKENFLFHFVCHVASHENSRLSQMHREEGDVVAEVRSQSSSGS